LFVLFAVLLIALHAPLLRLPYFWDEAGYYIPAARDLLAGSLIPYSTPSNAHPPLVLAWLALCWKIFGQSQLVTRCAMLLLAASSLLGFFRLARTVASSIVAACSTALVAIYPVFFTQSSLAQVDLPAAGLIFWGLESYFRRRRVPSIIWFSLAALAKETAILVPVALILWELAGPFIRKTSSAAAKAAHIASPQIGTTGSRALPGLRSAWSLSMALLPLALWYAYHYARTGYVFGNPEFFRYNVQETLHPLRIFLALLLRTWQTFGYLDLYVLTLACMAALMFAPIKDAQGERPRIDLSVQFSFLAIAIVYLISLSVIGGAVLARYMLPVVPLVILVCVSTIWRRLRAWKAVIGVIALAFVSALFVNPPYGFSPEDNLAYRDYIRLHQRAERFLELRYFHARVLTAWPASDELSRPYLGYVHRPIQVVKIEDFSAEQVLSAADARSRFDVALVFSTKYRPQHSMFDRFRRWQEWKSRYFGYHVDLTPEIAASVLGGTVVYVEPRHGQWVGIIEMEKIEEAKIAPFCQSSSRLR
jgi:4-amino-4-deoxy-L-arabinose transferase-like glycosyltransferase